MNCVSQANAFSITGSSSGIGRATALECARHGARLVLHHLGDTQAKHDIRTLREEIETLNRGLEIKAEAADVASDVTHPEAGQG